MNHISDLTTELSTLYHALKDGTIETSDGKKHKTPSGAAKHLNNDKPVDGWIAWRVKNSGIQLVALREKLLS